MIGGGSERVVFGFEAEDTSIFGPRGNRFFACGRIARQSPFRTISPSVPKEYILTKAKINDDCDSILHHISSTEVIQKFQRKGVP